MDTVTLTFSMQRLDYIANVLAQRPYAEVAAVLEDIRAQAARQQAGPVVGGSVGAPIGNGQAGPSPH